MSELFYDTPFLFYFMNPLPIIEKYYSENQELKQLLLAHSRAVAKKALECLKRRNLEADLTFVEEASMLHDIGIIGCNASSIYCYGSEPYIRHGIIGAEMLRAEGLPRHALVCERHTGAGLTIDDIKSQNLPLPHRDFLPETIEEKAICYADKFFSKSRRPDDAKPIEKIINQMFAHGEATGERFLKLHEIFG